MGLILDSSLLIADERGKFDMPGFLRQFPDVQPAIAAITASELLHGVERAQDAGRKARRERHVEQILAAIPVQTFDLAQARVHARIWAELQARGQMIGPHDLLIAAAGLALGHEVATLNVQEFQRVNGLKVIDATSFRRP
ncbi:MAG TPA: PIN domain-containing protein [Verrucomicrobiae bacterium]|nr:PIN domain-containing protein [Verrucomicrobiae bacterium]